MILTVLEILEASTARRMAEQFEATTQLKSASKHARQDCDLGRTEMGIYGKQLERVDSLLFVECET